MQIVCGQCRVRFKVEPHIVDKHTGGVLACPKCTHELFVPAMGHDVPAPDTAFIPNLPTEEEGFAEISRQAKLRIPKLAIVCESCGKTTKIGPRLSGMTIKCASCRKPVTVPWPDEVAAAKAAQEADVDIIDQQGPEEETPAPPKGGAEAPAATAPVAPADAAKSPSAAPPVKVTQVPPEEVAQEEHEAEYEDYEDHEGEVSGELAEAIESFERQLALDDLVAAVAPSAPAVSLDEVAPISAAGAASSRRFKRKLNVVRRRKSGLVVIIGLVIAGWLISIPYMLRRFSGESVSKPAVVAKTKTEPPQKSSSNSGQEVEPVTTRKPIYNEPPPVTMGLATFKVINATRDVFAAPGYFPAKARSMYWKVNVEIQAGAGGDFSFSSFGDDATLTASGVTVPSLGVCVAGSVLPVRAVERTVRVPAGQSEKVTLLFEGPEQGGYGKVAIRGAGMVEFTPGVVPKLSEALAGSFAETQPRNLRPLLKDPIMSAIQSGSGLNLLAKESADGYDISLPEVGLSGQAKSASPGLFSVVFKQGEAELKGKLRLIDGGKRLVFYLSDEPFHQLTFARAQ